MTDPLNSETRAELIAELKVMIVETLNLDDVAPSEIDEDAPLFESGLDLDSIDALEIVVSLEKEYSVKFGSSEESKAALKSVNTLADLIESKQG